MLVTVAQFAIMMTCTTHKHVFFIYCSARGNQSQTEIEDGMSKFSASHSLDSTSYSGEPGFIVTQFEACRSELKLREAALLRFPM